MSKKNTQIVRDYIEEVTNRKHYDHVFDYCSKDCVIHDAPYVGLGVTGDDRSGDRVFISEIAPNSPAAGKLEVKDELVHVKDCQQYLGDVQGFYQRTMGHGCSGHNRNRHREVAQARFWKSP